MASKSLKVLVAGSVNGSISKFFKKVNSINKKNGPFELLLCTGNLFGRKVGADEEWQKCVKGELKVSVPTYILGPTSTQDVGFYNGTSMTDGGELSPNVTYLGKKGLFKTLSGLSIAYISGEEEKIANGNALTHFAKTDVEDLVKNVSSEEGFKGVDILVTNVWPTGVTKYTGFQENVAGNGPLTSWIASKLKPRYHFSCSPNCYFERPPYRNHQVLVGEQEHVTRFISLAPFDNSENKKAIYAFSITPIDHLSRAELIIQPEDTTEFPYSEILTQRQKQAVSEEKKQDNFFFNISDKGKRKSGGNHEDAHRTKRPKGPPSLTKPCWFCLGSPEVEKHLVVSVGEHCYLALPKGGLNEDHIMICPIEHYNSTAVLQDEALMEIEKYKECLQKMFAQENKDIVLFERNFYTQHCQVQVIPVPKEKSQGLKELFFILGEEKGMNFIQLDTTQDLREVVSKTTPYFLVELSSGERLLHRVVGKMPIHFGREVLASPEVLNVPDKVNWKSCVLSMTKESQLAKKWREKFMPFDQVS